MCIPDLSTHSVQPSADSHPILPEIVCVRVKERAHVRVFLRKHTFTRSHACERVKVCLCVFVCTRLSLSTHIFQTKTGDCLNLILKARSSPPHELDVLSSESVCWWYLQMIVINQRCGFLHWCCFTGKYLVAQTSCVLYVGTWQCVWSACISVYICVQH